MEVGGVGGARTLLLAILPPAVEEVAAKLEAADQLALKYLNDYAAYYVGPKSFRRHPVTPRGLDPLIAQMIRNEVNEAATVYRMGRAA